MQTESHFQQLADDHADSLNRESGSRLGIMLSWASVHCFNFDMSAAANHQDDGKLHVNPKRTKQRYPADPGGITGTRVRGSLTFVGN
jgi:hypothetical protein